ncbi:DUF262 domain-containing HNH endonuclease family protein [Patescibacteria group bacterium]|nr:DUF262 domain-containing HNH endonuclease family protein [Patescibacteria group bacterium]
MDFFAKSYKLSAILQKREFIIPEFQREYTWGKDQLDEFWDDINSAEGDYFLGTIVLSGKDFDSMGPFRIIDGQQRLTTILILINRLIFRFENIKEGNELAEALKSRIFFKDDNAKDHIILQNQNAHKYFQDIVLYNNVNNDSNVEAKKLNEAKEYFSSKLKSFDIVKLKDIRNILLNLDFIVVLQDDDQSAINIFVTLNFRGVNLDILDLVKSFIVTKFKKQEGIDDPRVTWKNILENIKINRKNFFNRYWASYYEKISEPKLYKNFNNKKDSIGAENLLKSLLKFSEVYRDALDSESTDWGLYCPYDKKLGTKIRGMIYSLDKFNIKVHYSFLITLLELSKNKKIHQNKIIKMISIIEKFHFLFNAVCSYRPSGLDTLYSKYAVQLRLEGEDSDSIFSSLTEELVKRIPEKEEFISLFKELSYTKDKGLILYIFRLLEKKYSPGKDVDISEESLDHLSPQASNEVWTHNIGNLILLEKELNKKRDNKDLSSSYKIMEKTSFESTSNFLKVKLSKWDEEACKQRAIILAEEIYNYTINSLKI